ncbi:MAG: hypothetical protein DYG93_03750 [Leptolyngbya sp. PLA2]|nr:hypothetical protein [Leptolyngbya sp.]MCE7970768.1 hypothetical protein [Leptolyngbya sp. PL-A2]MCQ3939923.1 hypothetical protein [cyanobacterium CYA1]MCZ7633550.1 FG-GAP-like repeat-containing protein [Phycisphaerales bacterium]MDL1903332.1 hypothetical protein [Synechococcales cyanobacterium CNB]GIK18027.1 MAG: hypothetical protein BroJett004_01910 [Planctomycetota bacterium]
MVLKRAMMTAATVAAAVLTPIAIGQRTPEVAPPAALVQPRFAVESVVPPPEFLGFDRNGVVIVRFTLPIDPATLDALTLNVAGRWSGPVAGEHVLLDSRTVAFVRPRPYSPGERVTVQVSRGLKAINGDSLDRGFTSGFWARTGPGSLNFTMTGVLIPGDVPYGAHGGDLDDDGDLDLAVPNEATSNVSVFLNNGDGTFTAPVHYGAGLHCSPNEGLDLNGDGIVDLAVANILDHNVSILIGVGNGTFLPQVKYAVGQQPRGLAAFDADGDGFPDLVTANRVSSTLSFLRNRGDGTFDPAVSFDAGVNGETGVVAADMNGDGVMDLIVIGWSNSRISTMLGNGAGGFTLHGSIPTSSRPWMVACGDLNGDGIPDAAVACSSAGRAAIHFGDGLGGLGPETWFDSGEFPIAIDLGDLDGDGSLDMVTSSYGSGDFHVYTNNGSGVFTMRFTLPAVMAGSCAVLHDRDGDGDTDITGIDENADRIILYRQD